MSSASRSRPTKSSRVIQRESTGKKAIEQSRIRLVCIGALFLCSFLAISVRLVEITVFPGAKEGVVQPPPMAATNEEEDTATANEDFVVPEISLTRSDIVDRNGMVLATSISTASLFATPKVMNHIDEAAAKLAKALPLDEKQVKAKLKSGKSFVWIKRNLTPAEQQAVNSLGIPGLYFQSEQKRIYPHGRMLSHVLGYVGLDNIGQAGIEKHFDQLLRDKDRGNQPLALSIDLRIQGIMYEEMKKGVQEFNAIGATGMVVDINSGEVLAMANLPDFDPNRPGSAKDIGRFNRATLGTYEMGSTFKTFTMAMALDEGIVTMRDGYDASHPIHVANFTISDTHPQNRWLSVPEIYAYSSNIGTVKMIMDVGKARQKAFMEKIGMLRPVELELPERASPLYPRDWKDINMMTIAYGHGISVTPIHLVRGIATVVGDGTLANLTLVKDGNKDKAKSVRVVSEDTTRQIRRLMRLVVEHGTGSKSNIPGYRVGGKTGTAEKVQGHVYNANAKLSSFISTFPVDDPKYVVLIMIDEPQGNKSTFGYSTGGWTAAPVAGRIISRMAPMLGLRPVYDVPADDADKYWTKKEKKPEAVVARITPTLQENVHAVSY